MQIRKAERKKAKLRLGISGASGSGKTRSSLMIASGMGGKIGMIDTESGRGDLYANFYEYDIIRIDAPYTVDKYIQAIKMFEANGYDVLIIDSLSHAWVGDGGVLSVVDNGGGWFAAGGRAGSRQQNSLVDAIISSKMHIITTLRAKTEYVVEKNDKGKNEPRKIGLTPVQRDGIEYEYTVFMSMNQENIAHVTKDNTDLFNNEFFKPTQEIGVKLMEWLNAGSDPRELFINNTLPEIIQTIKDCESLDELREKYLSIRALYSDEFLDLMDDFVVAKDKRKEEILAEEMSELPDIQDVVSPVVKSKHSSKLVNRVARTA